MNSNHERLCPSPEWAGVMESEILPRVTAGIDLGSRMLELGPGPGAATEWLRQRVAQLVVLELDPDAATRLTERFASTNVEVRTGDATDLPWADDTFDSVGSFTMLHHLPNVGAQNALLSEALRVLRAGGVLVAADSLPSQTLHEFHEGDAYNPVEPGTVFTRLQTIGFQRITLSVDRGLLFSAHKPAADAQ